MTYIAYYIYHLIYKELYSKKVLNNQFIRFYYIELSIRIRAFRIDIHDLQHVQRQIVLLEWSSRPVHETSVSWNPMLADAGPTVRLTTGQPQGNTIPRYRALFNTLLYKYALLYMQ